MYCSDQKFTEGTSMRLVTASNKKQSLKLSRKEWESIGKVAGWMKQAISDERISSDDMKMMDDVGKKALRTYITERIEKLKKNPTPKNLEIIKNLEESLKIILQKELKSLRKILPPKILR
jgi:hypothetical protein